MSEEWIVPEIDRKHCYKEYWNTPGCKECMCLEKCKGVEKQ